MKHLISQSILFSFVIALLCSGCAVKYGPRIAGIQPGYVDQQLGESTFQIKIGEAWPKDWPDLEKFAMYRAAEITESKSKRYFRVLDASSQTSTYFISTPTTLSTSITATPSAGVTRLSATTTVTPGTNTTISGGWYILEFQILSDAELARYKNVVDSRDVKSKLEIFINSRR